MTRAQKVQTIAKILVKKFVVERTEAIHVAYLIEEALGKPETKITESGEKK